MFQSPSDRGGPFKTLKADSEQVLVYVSVPFRSGRAFQEECLHKLTRYYCRFSPLQIGEGLSREATDESTRPSEAFQSPSDRGGPFKEQPADDFGAELHGFSPLQIGEGLSRAPEPVEK